jgi:ribosome-binding protein aMBF1 (putative translation factor)
MRWIFQTLNAVVDEEVRALPKDMQARLDAANAAAWTRNRPAPGQGGFMTRLKDLKARLLKDPEVRRHYDAMEQEFALIAEVGKARARAGLSQAELAKRMKTTQSAVARLESGRGLPSTRTLGRFAKATGHRLKISFEPVRKRG